MIRVFILESNPTVLQALATRLQFAPNIQVVGTATLPLNVPQEPVDVLLFGLAGQDHDLAWLKEWIAYLVARQTAVIILTPYIDDHEQEVLLGAGVSVYLLKTINTPDLVAQIVGLIPV